MERKLWENWDSEKPIPLFISLASLNKPFGEAIQEALIRCGCPEAQIPKAQKTYSFIFFLDGYDELGKYQNLYTSNNFDLWKGKVVITCRTQYLSGSQSTYRNYFIPPYKVREEESLFEEVALHPFTINQTRVYLDKYTTLYPTGWSTRQCESIICSVPGLQEIMITPLLLRIVAEVLPQIGKKDKGSKENFSLTHIYDAFIEQWFLRGERRLITEGYIDGQYDIKENFLEFCKQLAEAMLQENVVSVEYQVTKGKFNRVAASKWQAFFDTQDHDLAHILSGVPICKIGPHKYAFIHKSILEYFGARSIFERIKLSSIAEESKEEARVPLFPLTSNKWGYLTMRLLTQNSEEIGFFADYVRQDETFKTALFELINQTKTDPTKATAAANAITILNAAKVAFSRKDFEGIQIPGADLSHAILDRTNLSRANLRGVKLRGAFLRNANLSDAQMESVEFGQQPDIKCSGWISCMARQKPLALSISWKGFEIWDYVAATKKIFIGKELTDRITCMAISSDGKCALSGGSDHKVRLWDLETGEITQIFEGHTHSINSIAFSLNEAWGISGSYNGAILIWDLKKGALLQKLDTHTHEINAVAIFAQRKCCLSDWGPHIRLWDLDTRKPLQTLAGHEGTIFSLVISLDEKFVLSGGLDQTVRLWDLESGKQLHILRGHTFAVRCVAISSNGQWGLSGSQDSTVCLWDLSKGTLLQTFERDPAISKEVCSVSFSPDEKYIVAGYTDGTLRSWNLNMKASYKSAQKSIRSINTVAFSPDGKWVRSLCWSAKGYTSYVAQFWDLNTESFIQTIEGDMSALNSAVIFSDKKQALLAEEDLCDNIGKLRLWDLEKKTVIKTFKESNLDETIQDFLLEEAIRLSKSIDSQNNQGMMPPKQLQYQIPESNFSSEKSEKSHGGYICIALSPDEKWAVSGGSEDNSIHLWDLHTGTLIKKLYTHSQTLRKHFKLEDRVIKTSFSPDGQQVLALSSNKTVYLWDLQTGTLIHSFSGHICLIFSSNRKWALLESEGHSLSLWNFETKTLAKKPLKLTSKDSDIDISPDGKLLFAVRDKSAQLYDLDKGIILQIIRENIRCIAFSPDGKWALSGGEDCSIKYWSLFDEKGSLNPVLIWSSHPPTLTCQGLNIQNVNLDIPSRTLLLQNGAVNKRINDDDEKKAELVELKTPIEESKSPTPQVEFAQLPHVHCGKSIKSLSVSCDETLTLVTDKNTIEYWDYMRGIKISGFRMNLDRSIVISSDGKWILSGGKNGVIRLRNFHKKKLNEMPPWDITHSVDCITISSKGEKVLLKIGSNIQLWDVRTKKMIYTFQESNEHPVTSAALSPDGTWALLGIGPDICFWDFTRKKLRKILQGNTGPVTSIAISPNKKRVLSKTSDNTILLWDLDKKILLRSLKGHTTCINTVAFSADGESAFFGTNEGNVLFWNFSRYMNL